MKAPFFLFDYSWVVHSELGSVSGDNSYSQFSSRSKKNFALCSAASLCRRPNWDIGTPMQSRSSAESPVFTMKLRVS